MQASAVLKHRIVLAELGEEIVKWLDGPSAKHLIQNVDLCQQLARDFLEASGQLGDVGQRDLEVVAEVGVLVLLQARNNGLDDDWLVLVDPLVHDLILSL